MINNFDFTITSQTIARTWIPVEANVDLARCCLGMVEELNEFTEDPCEKELGDFLFYLVQLANLLGLELSSEIITSPNSQPNLVYAVGKIKKYLRNDPNFDRLGMRLALSNLAFFVHQQALAIGTTPQQVQRVNQEKLFDRLNRNAIKGSGDDR